MKGFTDEEVTITMTAQAEHMPVLKLIEERLTGSLRDCRSLTDELLRSLDTKGRAVMAQFILIGPAVRLQTGLAIMRMMVEEHREFAKGDQVSPATVRKLDLFDRWTEWVDHMLSIPAETYEAGYACMEAGDYKKAAEHFARFPAELERGLIYLSTATAPEAGAQRILRAHANLNKGPSG